MSSKKRYECSSCNKVHDHEDLAQECCLPEVLEVWECGVCVTNWERKEEADNCCQDGMTRCPACARDYAPNDIAVSAIEVVGHCQACNPFFMVDQLHEIEQHHYDRTGANGSLSRGDSGIATSHW